MQSKIDELKNRLYEINAIDSAAGLMNWDQLVFMPPGANAARSRHLSVLARLSQEKFTDPAIGHLLDDLEPYAATLPYESLDAALVRFTRRIYDRAVKVPPAFMEKLSGHLSDTYQKWTAARPANNFELVRPALEKTLDFSRQVAEFFPGYEHIADPLINFHDYGMQASSVRKVFAGLRAQLVPLVKAITAHPPADDSFLRVRFPEQGQWDFGMQVAREIGFDFECGRQDKSPHPFTTSFSMQDVRITTRIDEFNFIDALFSTIHECGHGMYEQGVRVDLDGLPLDGGISSGVHESQSRLWENIVGRSKPFWQHYYPQLQAIFPEQLKHISMEQYHRAINKVIPSLIRTDADEVTYNLHVMLRFELELELLEGKLEVRHLPQAWNDRYRSDLGVTPPGDREGCLQDVHWYGGLIGGAFQGYALGNIMSAAFYEAALQAHPEIPAEIAQGKFSTLLGWLRENIYQYGRIYTADEMVQRITGGPLRMEPYMNYLRARFGELYEI
ncbi:MAG TPA: carboxypeptidase M32 [Anaerolineaceae bacterium]|nr:carboxypeptidase M32 [Anaerolineaceae bacterium]